MSALALLLGQVRSPLMYALLASAGLVILPVTWVEGRWRVRRAAPRSVVLRPA